MRLYVNGDSHTAAAEAVNQHAFAEDDQRYAYLGRLPHPDNFAVSWAKTLSRLLKAVLHNDSESASSNQRIMRTTRAWLKANHQWLSETVVIIQWSTWERQEWLIEGQYYQINASGIDHVPKDHQQRYRDFVTSVNWSQCTNKMHREIWDFHRELNGLGVRHLFFNGNNHFRSIPPSERLDWGISYIDPYEPESTYDAWLKNNGYQTVSPDSWHFGAAAHGAWARFMLQYGIKHSIWN
jgi:hypothetical protein